MIDQTINEINTEKITKAKIMVNEFLGDDNCDKETFQERLALFIKAISVTAPTSPTKPITPTSPTKPITPASLLLASLSASTPTPMPSPSASSTASSKSQISTASASSLVLKTASNDEEVSCTCSFKVVGKEGISIVREFLSSITGEDLREFQLKNVAERSLNELSNLEEQNVIIVLSYNSREEVVGFYLGFMTTEIKTNETKITLQGNLVYVLPSERRSGFGKSMNSIFQKAFETKVAELELPNGANVTVQRWIVVYLNNKIAMKFWADQGYNKGDSFYVDIHDYNQIVENYKNKENCLLTIKKEKLSLDSEASVVADKEDFSNTLYFSDDELAAIEASPSILVYKYNWGKIKYYDAPCFIPPYYHEYLDYSVPNPYHEENTHFFKDIKEVIKHLRRYGNRQPKTVDHLKKGLNKYGYQFEYTSITMENGVFRSYPTVWVRNCSFKGKGKWEGNKECIQRNDEQLFLGKDYFFDIKQIADYIIENTEPQGPSKEDLVY